MRFTIVARHAHMHVQLLVCSCNHLRWAGADTDTAETQPLPQQPPGPLQTGTRTSASTPPHSHLFPACTTGSPTRAHLHAMTSYDTNKSSGNGRCFSRVLARSRCLPICQRLRYPLVNRLS